MEVDTFIKEDSVTVEIVDEKLIRKVIDLKNMDSSRGPENEVVGPPI